MPSTPGHRCRTGPPRRRRRRSGSGARSTRWPSTRWDADTIGGMIDTVDPMPVPLDVADDGIAGFFDVFVATGIAQVPAAT